MAPLRIPYPELKTMRDWMRWSASQFAQHQLFFGHGTDNALDEAIELVLATLNLSHEMPESWLDARVTAEEAELLGQRIQQRIEQRLPLPYVTGRAFFAGLEFVVNQDVLIPRSPIAEWIERRFEPWIDPDSVGAILDLCCGSGCIGIACAHAFPEALVDLADISPAALEVARTNIERHHLDDRVRAIQSDVFKGLDGERYGLIVSNPPYVSTAEMGTLPEEYQAEPVLGLEAGEDGLDVVRQILAEAPDYLTRNGILVVEVGASADFLIARFPDVPFVWLDFEHGGDGVFLLAADQLQEFHDVFVEE